MFEEMGETAAAFRVVFAADVVPDMDRTFGLE